MQRRLPALAAALLLPAAGPLPADEIAGRVLPLRERAALEDRILRQRLDEVAPAVMRRAGIDAWVLIAREYNEDPVLKTMLPATWLNARRRTVLMFLDRGEAGVERMAVARYAVGDMFPGVWSPEEEPDQYRRVAEILREFDPRRIALNHSEDYGLADGLSHTERQAFSAALDRRLRRRIVSGEELAVGWLETRIAPEMEAYREAVGIAHAIIREGFSAAAVAPGTTTVEDLEWWFRQRVSDLGLGTWFHTSIEVERSDRSLGEIARRGLDPAVLRPGDHVHVDFGISYLNLQTDTQQVAYIPREGETDAPAALKAALAAGNRLQDILTGHFQVGRTGNEILRMSRERALMEGIGPIIYTHPIGLHGHAAGTTIGMWDRQEGVPGSGDRPMRADTAYSIELTALWDAPEWSGEPIRMKLEEDGFFDGEGFEYIQPRQTEYHIIRPPR